MSTDPTERISASELVRICGHYRLGTIRHVRKFPGGSRSSPKVLLSTDTAAYLLKRRAPGAASDPATVALTHEIMLHLEASGLPAPALVGTRDTNNSMLQAGGHVYEIYRFVRGRAYARTHEDACAAGSLLAKLHGVLAAGTGGGGFTPSWPAPIGWYHGRTSVPAALDRIGKLASNGAIESLCASLSTRYQDAASRADQAGVRSLAPQLVHADWHPGNLVFRSEPRTVGPASGEPWADIAAVLDFDSARLAPRALDIANGALQFAMGKKRRSNPLSSTPASSRPPHPSDAGDWHLGLDEGLLRAFFAGYRGTSVTPPSEPELLSMPWLMIESMITEAAVPIATTGTFGTLDPGPVLSMVSRAADALANASTGLVSVARTT